MLDRQAAWDSITAADGNVDRPLLADPWVAPGSSLELREGRLVRDLWSLQGLSFPRATLKMLEGFTGLASRTGKPDQPVLAFARKWGLLNLCEHHLPIDHDRSLVPMSFAAPNITFLPVNRLCRQLFDGEPISTWLFWSRQAAALVRVLVNLRQGTPARPDDWAALAEQPPWVSSEPELGRLPKAAAEMAMYMASGKALIEEQRDVASMAVETWLRLSGVSLQLRWPRGVSEVGFGGGQLMGAVGLGFMLAAVGASSWVVCPGCGRQHAPLIRRGRRPLYCEDCRAKRKPERDAQARYRAKSVAYRESNRKRAQANRAAKKEAGRLLDD